MNPDFSNHLPGGRSVSTRRRGVTAIIIRDKRFLIIRRSTQVVAPGAYCFPGGGIEVEETESEALTREIEEELGACVLPVRRLWWSVTPWNVELAWWLTDLPATASLSPNPSEVQSIHWCTMDEMQRLPGLLTSNLEFLAALASGKINLKLET